MNYRGTLLQAKCILKVRKTAERGRTGRGCHKGVREVDQKIIQHCLIFQCLPWTWVGTSKLQQVTRQFPTCKCVGKQQNAWLFIILLRLFTTHDSQDVVSTCLTRKGCEPFHIPGQASSELALDISNCQSQDITLSTLTLQKWIFKKDLTYKRWQQLSRQVVVWGVRPDVN